MQMVYVDSNYELLRASCPACGRRNAFSRRSDLNDLGRIAHRKVVCCDSSCAQEYVIGGDSIEPAYRMFYGEAYEFIRDKRFSYAILTVTQALEVFFAHAVRELWLLKLFDSSRNGPMDLATLNAGLADLYERTSKWPYEKMRDLFFSVTLTPVPATLNEGIARVHTIPSKPATPTDDEVERGPQSISPLLLKLKQLRVHELRNRIVHQRAYRPSREEAQDAARTVGDILVPLASQLGIEYDSF